MAVAPGELDEVDLALVAALQGDPRATAVQLAAAVGCAAPVAGARLRRLLDERVVEVVGYLHPGALGPAAMALAFFRSTDPAGVVAQAVTVPGVQLAVEVFGAWDGLCTLVARDEAGLDRLVDEVLRSRPDVGEVDVRAILGTRVVGVPDVEPVGLRDEADHAVARCLAADARASYAGIAAATGLKEATARLRAVRLLEGGAVMPLVIPDARTFGLEVVAGLAVAVDAPPASVAEAVAELPGVLLVHHLQGPAPVGVEVILPGLGELSALRAAVRALPGVRGVEVLLFARPLLGASPLPPEY